VEALNRHSKAGWNTGRVEYCKSDEVLLESSEDNSVMAGTEHKLNKLPMNYVCCRL